MTPEQIRTEAMMRVVRVLEQHRRNGTQVRASDIVDGLGDMLADSEQWGLLAPNVPFPDVVTPLDDEAEARRYLHDEPGRKLMHRWTHGWAEVPESVASDATHPDAMHGR